MFPLSKRALVYIVLFIVLLVLTSFVASPAKGPDGERGARVYFSPNGGCEKAIIDEITKAQTSIHIAMFCFTNGRIARTLAQACARGIDVKVVMDQERALDLYSKEKFLKNKGVRVKLKRGPRPNDTGREEGLMHHKFAIIDGRVVISGSYNWTNAAEKWNYENLLILPSASVAGLFEREFLKLWTEK